MRKGHFIRFGHLDVFEDHGEGSFSKGDGLEANEKVSEEIEAISVLKCLVYKSPQRDFSIS